MLVENLDDELMKLIESDPNRFMKEFDDWKLCSYERLFTEYFYLMLKSKGLTLKQLIFRTSISQSFIYQVASGRRHLGRDSAIVLAFAMGLSIVEAQIFLRYSCNATLYPCERRDAIILCCLRRGMTYEETDELLLGMGEQGLV